MTSEDLSSEKRRFNQNKNRLGGEKKEFQKRKKKLTRTIGKPDFRDKTSSKFSQRR